MARKSLLSAAIERPQAEANENTIPQPVADAVRAEAKRPNSNAGKYHLGGYFDQDDPTAEAFRVLAAKTRRKQQDLLGEAISALVAQYDARPKFGSCPNASAITCWNCSLNGLRSCR